MGLVLVLMLVQLLGGAVGLAKLPTFPAGTLWVF